MKKSAFLMLAALTLIVGLNACTDSNDPDQIAQFQQEFYNRVVDNSDNSVKYSTTLATVTLNGTKQTMELYTSVKVTESSSVSMHLTDLVLKYDATTGVYTITTGEGTKIDASGNTVGNFSGAFDMNTGVLKTSFTLNDTHRVYTTSRLIYPYGKSTSTYASDEATKQYTNENFSISIALNSEGTSATLSLYNVMLEENAHATEVVNYTSLPVTVTSTGYTFAASSLDAIVENVPRTELNITGFNATATNQGNDLNGSFKVNGHDVTFSVKMFK